MAVPTWHVVLYTLMLLFMVMSVHWWPWPWAIIPSVFAIVQSIGLPVEINNAVHLYRLYRAKHNDMTDVLEDEARDPDDHHPYDRYTS